MKICNVIQRYPPAVGGSETWAQEVLRFAAKQGHEVDVFTYNVNKEEEFWRNPPVEDNLLSFGPANFDKGVFVRRFNRDLPINLLHHCVYGGLFDKLLKIYFYGPHSVQMYGQMFKRFKEYDIIHTHTVPYPHNFVSYFASRLHGKKLVITPHFHPDHPHYERWSNYALLKKSDAVITVTEWEKDYLAGKGIDREKLFVSGNGINVEEYKATDLISFRKQLKQKWGVDESDQIVLFLGRKMESKGIDTLIESAKDILSKRKNVKFLLAGPNLLWFDKLYSKLSKKEKESIIDLGYLSKQEKVNLLHVSDLFVLPSKFEAFGIVFLEAWICGTPVIGSDLGAMPSVIGDGGLVAKFGNSIDLKEKIEFILDNKSEAEKMARNGKKKVLENFTWEKIGEKVEEVYSFLY